MGSSVGVVVVSWWCLGNVLVVSWAVFGHLVGVLGATLRKGSSKEAQESKNVFLKVGIIKSFLKMKKMHLLLSLVSLWIKVEISRKIIRLKWQNVQ